jgi:hypothetical protein
MKKLLVFLLCFLILCFPLTAFAEEMENVEDSTAVETSVEKETPPNDNTPEGDSVDTPEGDIPAEETPVEDIKTTALTVSDAIVDWIMENQDVIAFIVSIIGSCVAIYIKLSANTKATRVMNDNAVTIATESAAQMQNSRDVISNAATVVTGYDTKITELLGAFTQLMSENKTLKADITELKNYLHTATNANVELGNEIGELLELANIPNHVKDRMGTRHLEAVRAILDAEARANVIMEDTKAVDATVEEVKENDEA